MNPNLECISWSLGSVFNSTWWCSVIVNLIKEPNRKADNFKDVSMCALNLIHFLVIAVIYDFITLQVILETEAPLLLFVSKGMFVSSSSLLFNTSFVIIASLLVFILAVFLGKDGISTLDPSGGIPLRSIILLFVWLLVKDILLKN